MSREGDRETKLNNDQRTRAKLERLEARDWGERETRARDLEMTSWWREKNLLYLLITGRDYIYTLIHDRGKLSLGRVQADTGMRKGW